MQASEVTVFLQFMINPINATGWSKAYYLISFVVFWGHNVVEGEQKKPCFMVCIVSLCPPGVSSFPPSSAKLTMGANSECHVVDSSWPVVLVDPWLRMLRIASLQTKFLNDKIGSVV